jgi:hypothetical protein
MARRIRREEYLDKEGRLIFQHDGEREAWFQSFRRNDGLRIAKHAGFPEKMRYR